uniref:Uncharacterized protein n=1 Tax=Oryza nivara TaxID=4536 RepID=A0A0E0GTX4_ORYNI
MALSSSQAGDGLPLLLVPSGGGNGARRPPRCAVVERMRRMEARDGLPVSFLFKWCHSGESKRDRSVGGDNNKQSGASPQCLFHGACFHLRARRRGARLRPARPLPRRHTTPPPVAGRPFLPRPACRPARGGRGGRRAHAAPSLRAAVDASPSAVPVREQRARGRRETEKEKRERR